MLMLISRAMSSIVTFDFMNITSVAVVCRTWLIYPVKYLSDRAKSMSPMAENITHRYTENPTQEMVGTQLRH